MEGVAAVSLAASIVEFVNFGSKILSKGQEIYTSADGTSKDDRTVEVVVRHLKGSLGRIQGCSPAASTNAERLQEESTNLINEVLDSLEKLKVQGTPSKLKSIRKALKSVHSKDKIDRWLSRLESMREEYNTQLEVEILETVQLHDLQHTRAFEDLSQAQQALTRTLLMALLDNRDNFEAVAESHSTDLQQLIRAEHEVTRLEHSFEARATRDLIFVEQQQTRTQNVFQHEATREAVVQEGQQTIFKIKAEVEQHSRDMSLITQGHIDTAQAYIDNRITSEAHGSSIAVADAIEVAQFTTNLEVTESNKIIFNTLSAQLAQTHQHVEELRRVQDRQVLVSRNMTSPRPLQKIRKGCPHVNNDGTSAPGHQNIADLMHISACFVEDFGHDPATNVSESKALEVTYTSSDSPLSLKQSLESKLDCGEDDRGLHQELIKFTDTHAHVKVRRNDEDHKIFDFRSKYWVYVEWDHPRKVKYWNDLVVRWSDELSTLEGKTKTSRFLLIPSGNNKQDRVRNELAKYKTVLTARVVLRVDRNNKPADWLSDMPSLTTFSHDTYECGDLSGSRSGYRSPCPGERPKRP